MPSREDISFVAAAILDGALKPSQGKDLLSWKEFAEANGNEICIQELAVRSGILPRQKATKLTRYIQRPYSKPKHSSWRPSSAASSYSRAGASSTRSSRGRGIMGYEVVGRLGAGSMGTVYIARQTSTGRKVAIKVLSTRHQSREDAVERFYREANILRSVRHPNIVEAIEVGQTLGGQPYLVMEYIDGQSAAEKIRSQGRLTDEETIRIGRAVCQALFYLHSNGYIHRDIKPENILISRSGEIKLADFGLAKHENDLFTTREETTVGTPLYMSPEQARGHGDTDARSDIYSLGCNLYHMLTGQPPYPDKHPLAVMTKHLYEKTPWAQRIASDASPELCRVIYHMMMKDRDKRYPSVRDVALDLERVGAGEKPLRPIQLSREQAAIRFNPSQSEQQPRSILQRIREWFDELVPAYSLPG